MKTLLFGTVLTLAVTCLAWERLCARAPRAPLEDRALRDYWASPTPPTIYPLPHFEIQADHQKEIIKRTYMPYKWDLGGALHALRLRDLVAEIEPGLASEYYQLQLLFTNQREMDRSLPSGAPMIVDTVFGMNYRSLQDPLDQAQPHVDNLLAEFGELGVPLSQPLVSRGSSKTLGHCLNDSLKRAGSRVELEWTLVAYCAYLKDPSGWRDSLNNNVTVDGLTQRLLAQPAGSGPCFGTHREYALARLAATDEAKSKLLGNFTYIQICNELKSISSVLETTQLADGSWDGAWHQGMPGRGRASPLKPDVLRLAESMEVTGHILEWSSVCPTPLRPSEEVLEKAAHFCVHHLLNSDELYHKQYPAVTHAVRAVLQLRRRPNLRR